MSVRFTFESPDEYSRTTVTGQYLLSAQIIEARLRAAKIVLSSYLDYGCGLGKSTWPVTDLLATPGLLAGVDLSEQMIARARLAAETRIPPQGLSVAFEPLEGDGYAMRIPFADSTFDAAGSSIVLQEVHDPSVLDRIAVELHRVIRPAGHLILVCVSDRITTERYTSFTYHEFEENKKNRTMVRKCRSVESDIVWEDDCHWPAMKMIQTFLSGGFSLNYFDYPYPDPSTVPFPSRPEVAWLDELRLPPLYVVHLVRG